MPARAKPYDPADEAEGGIAAIEAIREGLPISVVDRAIEEGRLTPAELDRLVLPRKTLAHRRQLGRLSPEQSDRLARVLRVIAEAEETFANREKAHWWLRRPTTPLDNHAPLDLLDTDAGTHKVQRLLVWIAHGIAA